MRAPLAFALLVAASLVAGCVGADSPATPGGSDSASYAGLSAPPTWQAGDWWTYAVHEPFSGATHEVTQIVAGFDNGSALVGFEGPWEAADPLFVLHLPALGEVDVSDLGWEMHDEAFDPLVFPLVDGATWSTRFEGLDAHATVIVESPTVARIMFTGGLPFNLTYDATVGAITHMESSTYASWEMLDHGTGFTGQVSVPLGMDLVFLHGRVAGVADINLAPAPPLETVTLSDDYDRLTFALLAGTILPANGPQAVYYERVTAPNGAVYEFLITPADPPGLRVSVHAMNDPGGDWQFLHVAGGPGVTAVEGLAYRTATFSL